MAKIIFGNHSALRVPASERERIRKFYVDVLGGEIMRNKATLKQTSCKLRRIRLLQDLLYW